MLCVTNALRALLSFDLMAVFSWGRTISGVIDPDNGKSINAGF